MAAPIPDPAEKSADETPASAGSQPLPSDVLQHGPIPVLRASEWSEAPAISGEASGKEGKGDADKPIVLPKKREVKAAPKINVLEAAPSKEAYRFVDRDGGGGKPKHTPEVVKVGEKQEKSWQNQLPLFRPVPEKSISFGAVIRIFSDLELSHWTKSRLPSKRVMATVVCGVALAILTGHAWDRGLGAWFEQQVLGMDPAPEHDAQIVRYERVDPLGQTELPAEMMEVFVAEVDQLFQCRQEAETMFAKYCSANLIEDSLYFMRKQKGVEELVRQLGAPKLVPSDWRPGFRANWLVRTTSVKPYALLTGTFPGGEEYHAYFLIENGQLAMDWKATTAYSSASFKQLSNGEGDPSEIRGWLMPDVYFNAAFVEAAYDCYRMLSPSKNHVIWCYTERGSRISQELNDLLIGGPLVKSNRGDQRVTVKLRKGPEGSMPNQWMVEEIIHNDWLLP